MALPTLNLDDRSYAQLLEILKGHIPGEEWSDHNPSDPGITLLELVTWLGEMSLYRMNRVPAAHRDKFLKLLADPPRPVTVDLVLRLDPPRAQAFALPPGLRFATDYENGRRVLFESYTSVTLAKPPSGGEQTGTLRLRAIREIEAEPAGVGNGLPDQVFPIAQGPVLVDFSSLLPGYNPNPRLRVGADEWELRPFLRSASSLPSPLPPKHFMVDEFEGVVRFGDGGFGAIPPAGAAMQWIAYQVLEGPSALVSAGKIRHLLNPGVVPGLLPGDSLEIVSHGDAQGGGNVAAPGTRMQQVLQDFRAPSRLITTADFELQATVEFNRYQHDFNIAQGLAADPPESLIQRATALMNRKPPLVPGAVSPGCVTLLILPGFDAAAFAAAPLSAKAAMVAVPDAMRDRLLAFLEPRRLLTTRLFVAAIDLKAVNGQIVLAGTKQSNTADLERAALAALTAFLDPAAGYGDGRGWPLGRALRRSQIFELLEALPGVDHVESLNLQPAAANGDVEMGPRQLPVWDTLTIQVKRV